MASLFVFLQYLLPHQLLSRVVGWFAESRLGGRLLIAFFLRRYGVDLSEAVIENAEDFPSFNAFFTRALKPGARPLPISPAAIVSPADGTVSQLGHIREQQIIQAKKHSYSCAALLGGDRELAQKFDDGSFMTIYLSPRDYHRVHMPANGTLERMIYIPGRLFSVNPATTERVPGLFARNERVACLFQTEFGPMAVVLVGAMIVASIETVWHGQVCPGNLPAAIHSHDYVLQPNPVQLKAGGELGRFQLGSSVVVLFPKGAVSLRQDIDPGATIRMGETVAELTRRG